jgi:predicted metal-dependent hydrolase
MIVQQLNNELTYHVSTIDNKKYLVRNDDRKMESANYMAKIHKKIYILIEHVKTNFPNDERIHILTKKYNPDNISESMKSSIYTSYSVNKGEKIVICIKEKDANETLIDMNTIMFVVIHEVAHIITKSVGHTKEFWDNMKFLLQHAIKLGIYSKEEYKSNPKKYCGIMITDSPID